MNRAELKAMAKQQIKGNVAILFVIALVACIVISIATIIPLVGTLIVGCAFAIAMVIIFLKLAQGVKPEIAELFRHFDKFWASFKVTFFVSLFTGLWSMLFVIPGIVKSFSYSMAMFILAENPGMGALEAITKSRKMMDGHKMEFFILQLSFIGWHLLGSITFGIAYIWVLPYITATTVNFYNSIKNTVEAA